MNGAHWLVKTLQRRGVEYVFALCGNGAQTVPRRMCGFTDAGD